MLIVTESQRLSCREGPAQIRLRAGTRAVWRSDLATLAAGGLGFAHPVLGRRHTGNPWFPVLWGDVSFVGLTVFVSGNGNRVPTTTRTSTGLLYNHDWLSRLSFVGPGMNYTGTPRALVFQFIKGAICR